MINVNHWRAVVLPSLGKVPDYRRTYFEHEWFIDQIRESVMDYGSRIVEERVATSADGDDCIGAMRLRQTRTTPHGVSLWFGFCNANSNRQVSRFYAGMTGDDWSAVTDGIKLWRKGEKQIRRIVEDAVARFMLLSDRFKARLEELKRKTLTQDQQDLLTLWACRRGVIGWKYVRAADADKGDRMGAEETALEFVGRMGRVIQRTPPISQCPKTNQLTRMLFIYRKVME